MHKLHGFCQKTAQVSPTVDMSVKESIVGTHRTHSSRYLELRGQGTPSQQARMTPVDVLGCLVSHDATTSALVLKYYLITGIAGDPAGLLGFIVYIIV